MPRKLPRAQRRSWQIDLSLNEAMLLAEGCLGNAGPGPRPELMPTAEILLSIWDWMGPTDVPGDVADAISKFSDHDRLRLELETQALIRNRKLPTALLPPAEILLTVLRSQRLSIVPPSLQIRKSAPTSKRRARADVLIDRIGRIVPLAHREELLGDLREEAKSMRFQGVPEKGIVGYVRWQFFWVVAERLLLTVAQ